MGMHCLPSHNCMKTDVTDGGNPALIHARYYKIIISTNLSGRHRYLSIDWFWFNFATLNRDVILLASMSGNPSNLSRQVEPIRRQDFLQSYNKCLYFIK